MDFLGLRCRPGLRQSGKNLFLCSGDFASLSLAKAQTYLLRPQLQIVASHGDFLAVFPTQKFDILDKLVRLSYIRLLSLRSVGFTSAYTL